MCDKNYDLINVRPLLFELMNTLACGNISSYFHLLFALAVAWPVEYYLCERYSWRQSLENGPHLLPFP